MLLLRNLMLLLRNLMLLLRNLMLFLRDQSCQSPCLTIKNEIQFILNIHF